MIQLIFDIKKQEILIFDNFLDTLEKNLWLITIDQSL